MMLEMVVAAALSCPKPTKHVLDGSRWTPEDRRFMEVAKRRCVHHYPTQPCLIRFFKKGYHEYYAECGRKR